MVADIGNEKAILDTSEYVLHSTIEESSWWIWNDTETQQPKVDRELKCGLKTLWSNLCREKGEKTLR